MISKYSQLRNALALALAAAAAGTAMATTVTIFDNVIGGNAFCQGCGGYSGAASHGWTTQDVIQGAVGQFEIDRMVVDLVGNNLDVRIYSRYLNNIGLASTTLGDLLIAPEAWTAVGNWVCCCPTNCPP